MRAFLTSFNQRNVIMKKIISLFLALSILICFTACFGGNENTATEPSATTVTTQTTTEATTATTEATTVATTYPGLQKPSTKAGAIVLFSNAKYKSTKQKSYSAEIFEEITVTSNKSEMNVSATSENDFNILSDSEYSILMKETINFNGESVELTSNIYAKDGFYYFSEAGVNLKYESTEETDAEFDLRSELSDRIKSVSEHSISQITEDENAIYITSDLKKDNSYSIFDEILTEVEASIESLADILSVETQRIITSAQVVIAIDRDGYLKSYSPSITFSYMTPTDGVSAVTKISYVYSVSFLRDQEVKLNIPEGYENFPLYSEESLVYDTLSAAIEKTLALTDYSLTRYGTMEMEFSSMYTEILYRDDMYVKNEDSNSITLRETLQLQAFNALTYYDVYYENGFYYITTDTQTGKVPKYQIDEAPSELIKPVLTEAFVLINKDSVIESSSRVTEDSETEFYFLLDETYFRLNFSSQIDTYLELLGTVENPKITEPEVYIYVTEDGYISCYDVVYYLEGTLVSNGAKVNILTTIYDTFEFNAIGEDVTITPPTGYQSFPNTNIAT